MSLVTYRHHNNTQNNDTKHYYTEHKVLIWDTAYMKLSIMALDTGWWGRLCHCSFIVILNVHMLSVFMLSHLISCNAEYHYAECHYAECRCTHEQISANMPKFGLSVQLWKRLWVRPAFSVLWSETTYLKVENSAQTAFRLSPFRYWAPNYGADWNSASCHEHISSERAPLKR